MKKTLLQGAILILVVSLVWIAGEKHGAHQRTISVAADAPATMSKLVNPPPPLAPTRPLVFMGVNEWSQYRKARDTTFENSPDLAAEYKGMLKKMDVQQAKVDAAVFKADPKIKPVMDKLVALRQRNTSPMGGGAIDKSTPTASSVNLTSEDLQELRTARAKALQSNPDLVTNAQALAGQMRTFEDKLDAAMIKADPEIAPLITKFEGAHRNPALGAK